MSHFDKRARASNHVLYQWVYTGLNVRGETRALRGADAAITTNSRNDRGVQLKLILVCKFGTTNLLLERAGLCLLCTCVSPLTMKSLRKQLIDIILQVSSATHNQRLCHWIFYLLWGVKIGFKLLYLLFSDFTLSMWNTLCHNGEQGKPYLGGFLECHFL